MHDLEWNVSVCVVACLHFRPNLRDQLAVKCDFRSEYYSFPTTSSLLVMHARAGVCSMATRDFVPLAISIHRKKSAEKEFG